jgi:hypothetical protein
MRIIADKAISGWLKADQRNSETWKTVKAIVQSGEVDELCGLADAVIESFKWDSVGALGRLEVRALFLAGSGDGIMPEEMGSYLGS